MRNKCLERMRYTGDALRYLGYNDTDGERKRRHEKQISCSDRVIWPYSHQCHVHSDYYVIATLPNAFWRGSHSQ